MSQTQEPSPRVPDLGVFCLGEWSVCQAEGTLGLAGRSVRLEPRVMDVLVCLAAEPGRVVSKEELLEAVWGGAIVEEGALSQAVHSLRKALGDDARQPRYIQTIPKRGYRLLASVTPIPAEPLPQGAEAVVEAPVPGLLPSPIPSLIPPPVTSASQRSRGAWLLLLAITLGTVVAAALWLYWADAPRIVVLPFENLGKPEEAFFADGLTEEITKGLASVSSLQVISRTSALSLEGQRMSIREIGEALRVDYVLEGTVRWAQGPDGKRRVRITPQLIRVEDDTHVWVDSYDREVEVEDIFEVQGEISSRVIAKLGITLMPEEQRKSRQQPTKNEDAYRAYLRGLDLRNQPFYSEDDVRRAVPMFERAVTLDPRFAVAWAELSQTHSYLAFNADPSPARVELARTSLKRALALAPELPEVRLAQAYFTYRCLEDYEAAEKQLTEVARLSPNDPNVLQPLGYVLRRRGRMREAIDKLERASSLDPLTARLLWAIAETHQAVHAYKQADHYYEQAVSLAPDQAPYWEERALNRLDWTGDLEEARQILEGSPIRDQPKLFSGFFVFDFYGRDYERALTRLTPENRKAIAPQLESRIITLGMIARDRLGDARGALAMAEANRALLEARVRLYPMDPFYKAYLAVVLARLGRQEEARARMEEVLRMVRHDAFTGPRLVEVQAMMEVLLGRRREPIERLKELLDKPHQSSLSVADLRLNPVWDPLRDEPAFTALLRNR